MPTSFVLTCHLCPFEGKNLGHHLESEHGAVKSPGCGVSDMRIENAIRQADEVAAVRAIQRAVAGEKPGRIHPDDRLFAGVLCAAKQNRWPLVRMLGLNSQTVSRIFTLYDSGELLHRDLVVCS